MRMEKIQGLLLVVNMKGFNKKLAECEHLFETDKANDFQQGYMVAGIAIKAYPFDDEKSRKTTRDFFNSASSEDTLFNRGVMSAARDAKADRNEFNNVAPNGVKGKGENMARNNVNNQEFTPGEKAAYHAGRGYEYGKAGKRVPIEPENQESFRNGINRADNELKRNIQAASQPRSATRARSTADAKNRTDKEKRAYFSKRVNDKSLTQGQRNYAARRLEALCNK